MSRNTITKRRLWVSPETLEAMLTFCSSPYVGQLPTPIVQAIKPRPQEVLKAFDLMAGCLSPIGSIGINVSACCKVGQNGVPLSLQTIGRGAYGAVYQLTVAHQHYALKIYHIAGNAEAEDMDGVWHETRTALYFPRKPLKDIARFYCGNPKAGWALFELITPEMSIENREGLEVSTFPVNFWDGYNNSVSGIRVDYGGINARQKKITIGLRGFMNALKNSSPNVQAQATTQIPDLPEADRKTAFDLATTRPYIVVQANAAAQISSLVENDRKAAFEWAMATQISTIQANAAAQIGSLAETDRKAAFKQAMATQIPSVQANAVTQISYLPPSDRKAAFEQAMAIQEPTVQANAVTQTWSLLRSERKAAFESAMTTQKATVQASAANQIWSLSENDRMAAFELAISTQKPTVQANAAVQTKFLSKPEQKSVLADYIQAVSQQQRCLETLQDLTLSIGLGE
jgi:hypothetical protein